MGVSIFGVTVANVGDRFGGNTFTDISARIEEWILDGGAAVSAIVREVPGIEPSDVPTDEPLYRACKAYVVAYAGKNLAMWMTRQYPQMAVAFEEELKRLEKTIRSSPVGQMGDSFDRKEHLGTFRGGRARGGGGRAVKGSHGWNSKTRM